jgi:regulator of protease activity HflC (stomatin/prohibitin superfamily)
MFLSPFALYVIPIVVVVALVLIAASVRILREYERAVVFSWDVSKRSKDRASCC